MSFVTSNLQSTTKLNSQSIIFVIATITIAITVRLPVLIMFIAIFLQNTLLFLLLLL